MMRRRAGKAVPRPDRLHPRISEPAGPRAGDSDLSDRLIEARSLKFELGSFIRHQTMFVAMIMGVAQAIAWSVVALATGVVHMAGYFLSWVLVRLTFIFTRSVVSRLVNIE